MTFAVTATLAVALLAAAFTAGGIALLAASSDSDDSAD